MEVTLANVLEKVINDEEIEAGYGDHAASYVDRVKDGYDYTLIDYF